MLQKITFSELCTKVSSATALPHKDVEEFMRTLFGNIAEALVLGESVRIKGIGTFKLTRVSERKSVNVTTGEEFIIPQHSKITFVPSKGLAAMVNAPFAAFEAVELADSVTDELISSVEDNTEFTSESSPESASETPPAPQAPLAPFITDENTSEATLTPSAEDNTVVEADTDSIGNTVELHTRNEAAETVAMDNTVEAAVEYNVTISDDNVDNTDGLTYSEECVTTPTVSHPHFTTKQECHPEYETLDIEYSAKSNPDTENENRSHDIHDETSSQSSEQNIVSEHTTDTSSETPAKREHNRHYGFFSGFVCAIALICIIFIALIFFSPSTLHRLNISIDNNDRLENAIKQEQQDEAAILQPNSQAQLSDTIHYTQAEKDSLIPDTKPSIPGNEKVTQSTTEKTPPKGKTYDTITRTRYLTTMAKEHYGNYNLWPYIYEENKSFLGHPDRIRPGTQVVIPDLAKYGVDPKNPADIDRAKRKGVAIYARYK